MHQHENEVLVFKFILYTCIIISCVVGIKESYCEEKDEAAMVSAESPGRIFTRLQQQTYYDKNQDCSWLLDSGRDDLLLQLEVINNDLHWSPESAICPGYDYVEVVAGRDKSGESLAIWCGQTNPGTIISTGRYLYVHFHSNDWDNQRHSGVTLQYIPFSLSEELGACPPGWVENSALGAVKACYQLRTHSETWVDAQKYCNYDQANLVSLENGQEVKFVTGYVQNLTESKVWLSLHDIPVEGQYEWIDHTTSINMSYRWESNPHYSDVMSNCVAMSGETGMWSEEFCIGHEVHALRLPFVCKLRKIGPHILHVAPKDRIEKGIEGNVPVPVKFILVAIGIGIMVFLAGGFAAFWFMRKRKRQMKYRREITYRYQPANVEEPEGVTAVAPPRGSIHTPEEPTAPPLPEQLETRPAPYACMPEPPPTYDQALNDNQIK